MRSIILLFASACAGVALTLERSANVPELLGRTARYHLSCDSKIPYDSRTYRERVEEAFGDASQLALVTQEGRDSLGNAFTESTAYSHYFNDADKAQVVKMMQIIYNSRLPVDDNDGGRGYYVDMVCGSAEDPDTCVESALAATNPEPGETSMVFCDRFFSRFTEATKKDLAGKPITSKRGGWCQPGVPKFGDFAVAGLVALHEMTHLHLVGERAGLPAHPDPEGFESCGTVDVYAEGSTDDQKHYRRMEPWQAARELHRLWTAHNADETNYRPTTPEIENAESYAAAALEFYFLHHCKWDVIDPDA